MMMESKKKAAEIQGTNREVINVRGSGTPDPLASSFLDLLVSGFWSLSLYIYIYIYIITVNMNISELQVIKVKLAICDYHGNLQLNI